MRTRILWLSKYPMTIKQEEELIEAFGEIQVFQVTKMLRNGKELVEMMLEYNADEVVTALPLRIVDQACRMGVHPIRPIITQSLDCHNRPVFEHDRFERVDRIDIISHPLSDEKE